MHVSRYFQPYIYSKRGYGINKIANSQPSDMIYFSLHDFSFPLSLSHLHDEFIYIIYYDAPTSSYLENRHLVFIIWFINLISNWTIRDSPLFMFPFQSVDFRRGIIRLTALAISLSTIDTRRLLRWKSMSIIAQWLPAVSPSLRFRLSVFSLVSFLRLSNANYIFMAYVMAYMIYRVTCCIISWYNLLLKGI